MLFALDRPLLPEDGQCTVKRHRMGIFLDRSNAQPRADGPVSADAHVPDAQPKRKWLGFLAVFFIAASTVLATQLTRSAQNGLHAPFFVMYVHITMMTAWLPLAHALARGASYVASLRQVVLFLPLWLASNYCLVQALAFAPAGLVQTLFGTGPAQVAVLSRFVLSESFTALRVTAVVLAFLGTLAVGSGSFMKGADGKWILILGACFALCAVLASASYKVGFKASFGEAPLHVVLGFVGTLGLVTAAVGLPVSFALGLAGVEDRWWESGDVNWSLVVGSAAVDVVYNTSIACGLAVASPVFISVGIVLGIPANLAIDAIMHREPTGLWEVAGAFLIIASFSMLAASAPRREASTRPEETFLESSSGSSSL